MGEKRSNHTVYNVNYHFVWCPKYRHAILEPIEDSLEASFRDVCDAYDYEILSSSENQRFSGSRETSSLERLHISPDHVHLFLSAHPKHAPSEIVRTVKSITAREMWEQHEPFLEEYLWGGGFWEESYYVGTAGNVSTDTIEQYIEQTEHV
ncbi:IS200/IS605 family transposase [Halobellus inordinatus]|uniref:IS200/IS605 family transposase n=1 Tax=Halobellus inordinatus TaxID=1126236 RepID=UPI0021091D7F|nr:IS200/IS605 family transposase [Halobellus inordinatus]